MPHVCTGTALPVFHPAQGFLPIPYPLNPLSCPSNKSIGLQPNLFFQQTRGSRRTGRILIRLLRSSWVSFDQDYNLPKKRLHVQTWVSEQRSRFSSAKGDIHSAGQGNCRRLGPALRRCCGWDGALPHVRGAGVRAPHIWSDEEGAGHAASVQTHRRLLVSRNVATCKSAWKSFTVTSARLADMINFFLFLLWSLTSYPASSGVTAVWKTRPRFVRALWNAIRSPSAASRSLS